MPPSAKFDDGVLDLIEMGDISPLAMLTTVLPKVYSGSHIHHPKVRASRGTSFRFEAAVEMLVDLDGETVGRLPLDVSVVPRGFRVGAVGPR
jgi:diacylglycerol kinase family enzyme